MTLKNAQPIFNPATHYRIEVQGQVDVEWLQSFDSSVEIIIAETEQMEQITVLHVHTDQSGIVGLTVLSALLPAALAYVWFLNYWNLLGWRY